MPILLGLALCSGEMMAKKDSLTTYRARRDVKKSGEPAGDKKRSSKEPIFVIQKHSASHLHYDVRLEIDGVLKSWAVPKGPSTDTKVKRLAVPTDDHPMDYATFEGAIPEGHYGAGEVVIWDSGTYKNIKEKDGKFMPMKECYKRGTVEVILEGKRLHGAFALIRMAGGQWLMIKMKADKDDLEHESKPISKKKVKAKASSKQDDSDPEIKIGEHIVTITHPNKMIFPQGKILKKEVIDYYQRIAPTMLPHMKNRPISMQRFVDGITGEGFYQKEAGAYFPDWIERVSIKKQEGGIVHHVVVNNEASLVYLANQLSLVFHTWLSTTKNLHKPDRMIFDLDPSGKDFNQVRRTALDLKALLEDLELQPFVMTTGSRGLHVVVPLKPELDFDVVRDFAHDAAKLLVVHDPKTRTLEMRKTKRTTKIFIDYLRNGFTATGVTPYSLRARPGAPVATPLEWAEVSKKTLKPDQFTIKNIFKRLARKGDPWKDINDHAVSLKKAIKLINALKKEEGIE